MSCDTCRFRSVEHLDGLINNTGWSGKRDLTGEERGSAACTLCQPPMIVTRTDGCACFSDRRWWARALRAISFVLIPWAWEIVRRYEAKKALDGFAQARDDALVTRSALSAVWARFVEIFHDSSADLRGTLSTDDEGMVGPKRATLGRHNNPDYYKGWNAYAHRTHVAVGLHLKKLGYLRARSKSICAAIDHLDIGRPDAPSGS